jgi:anti-anti-sigma factor
VTASTLGSVWEETARFVQCRARLGMPAVIDLSQVRFMDSSGLSLMVRARKLAGKLQTRLEFREPSEDVLNVVQLARLDRFLLGKTA